MCKNIFLILTIGMFILETDKLSLAMMCGGHSGHQQTAQSQAEHKYGSTDATAQATPKEAIEVGNKICPVSAEKINEKLKATYEYKGKIYNFCCASCIEEFKKAPEKYIKKVEEELRAEKAANSTQTHQGHAH